MPPRRHPGPALPVSVWLSASRLVQRAANSGWSHAPGRSLALHVGRDGFGRRLHRHGAPRPRKATDRRRRLHGTAARSSSGRPTTSTGSVGSGSALARFGWRGRLGWRGGGGGSGFGLLRRLGRGRLPGFGTSGFALRYSLLSNTRPIHITTLPPQKSPSQKSPRKSSQGISLRPWR